MKAEIYRFFDSYRDMENWLCVNILTFEERLRQGNITFRAGSARMEYRKSPVRGCVLTGLEEVGMKERRETSFHFILNKAIIVPY